MIKFSRFALAAALAGVLASPALAQTASTTTPPAPATATAPDSATPPSQVQTPLPDSGMKKAPAATHAHHRTHKHSHAKAATDSTAPAT